MRTAVCAWGTGCCAWALSFFFFLMIRRPPRSTLFPYTRSSDLHSPHRPPRRLACSVHAPRRNRPLLDRKSTRLNSSHGSISYAVFCLKQNHDELVQNPPVFDANLILTDPYMLRQ